MSTPRQRLTGKAFARATEDRRADTTLAPPSPRAGPFDLASRLRQAHRSLRVSVESRATLLDLIRAVTATLDPAGLAEALIARMSLLIPAPCWAVVSADLSGTPSVLYERELGPDLGPAARAVAAWASERDEAFFSADLRVDSRIADASTATVIALPLASRGRRVGAIIALDRLPSSEAPRLAPAVLCALQRLLEPAAAALDAALLLQRAEALSVTDDLTRLYNSRYLNQVLRREVKRASRSGRPLSVLFLDLDGFKAINDTYGHLAGSRALVEAGAVIRTSARETDIVARFGGDEFAIVLPDTGGSGAVAVGERIRARIAEHSFLAGDGVNHHLTASVGVATLPDVALSPDGLLQAADAAMYQVKDRGKNGIQSAAGRADI